MSANQRKLPGESDESDGADQAEEVEDAASENDDDGGEDMEQDDSGIDEDSWADQTFLQVAALLDGQLSEFVTHGTQQQKALLPLSRIKRVMRADDSVAMIGNDAPLIMSKACEFFISELSVGSWLHARVQKRRTLLKKDVVVAASNMPLCNFLSAIMPTDCPDCPLYNPLSFAPYVAAMESYRIMLLKRQTLHPPPQEVVDGSADGDVAGAAGKKVKGDKTKR